MKKIIILLAVIIPLMAISQGEFNKIKLENKYDSISYCLGLLYASNLKVQGIDKINLDACMNGMKEGLAGNKFKIPLEEANIILQDYMQHKQDMEAENNLKEGQAFLAKNKEKKGVVVMPSGLQYKVLESGNGKAPRINSTVKVHYKGTLLDGTVFDETDKKGEPATFVVGNLIKGWQEALVLMRTGSKWKLFIPPDLAYREKGAGEVIGPNATLVFEIELIEIVE